MSANTTPPTSAAGGPHAPLASPVPAPAPSPKSEALARLQASRVVLARRLLPPPPAPDEAPADGPLPLGRHLRAWGRLLRKRVARTPVAPLLDTAEHLAKRWWQRQAWRPTAEALGREAQGLAAPWVRRHPWAAVGAAAALGAALAWAKPWRAPWLAPHVQPLPGRARSWLWAQVRQLPLQAMWPTLLGLLAAYQSARADGPGGAPADNPTHPHQAQGPDRPGGAAPTDGPDGDNPFAGVEAAVRGDAATR